MLRLRSFHIQSRHMVLYAFIWEIGRLMLQRKPHSALLYTCVHRAHFSFFLKSGRVKAGRSALFDGCLMSTVGSSAAKVGW